MIDLSGLERILAGQGSPERKAGDVWQVLRRLVGLRSALGPRLQVQTRTTTVWREEPLNELRAWLTPSNGDYRAEVSVRWRGEGRLPHPSDRFDGAPSIELFRRVRGDRSDWPPEMIARADRAEETFRFQPDGIATACSLARILWEASFPPDHSRVPSGRTGALRWAVCWDLAARATELAELLDAAREVLAVEAVEDRFGFDPALLKVDHGSFAGSWRAYCFEPCFNGEEITDPQPGRALVEGRRRSLVAEFIVSASELEWGDVWFASAKDVMAAMAVRHPGGWKLR